MGKHQNPRAIRDVVGYHMMHKRVRDARGRAADQQCVFCDNPATQWAYDHADPLAIEQTYRPGIGKPHVTVTYSLSIDHYVAMCRSCHTRYDKKESLATCGTTAGYHRHRRRGEPICEPCRRAHSAKSLAYWREHKQRKPTGTGWPEETHNTTERKRK